MRDETDWQPEEEEIAWTRDALENIAEGGTWAPHGLEYLRTGASELKLVSMVHHAGTVEAHARIRKVLEHLKWGIDDDSVERISHDVPPEIQAQAQQAELERIQAIVSGWLCPNDECGKELVNMPLERVAWVNEGLQKFLNPETNEEGEAERWMAHITCDKCSQGIPMNPLDYGYIAGEDLFYTWRFNDTLAHRVLTREQTVILVDSGEGGTALGSTYQGIQVPPHMQGTYCKTLLQSDLGISEEE
mgnify:CR=1 FL=1